MTFLLIVLAIHFALEWLAHGKGETKENKPVETTIHPAEFNLR